MALEVKLVSINNLKGKYDRFAKLMFRGVTHVSNILEGCGSDAKFNQVFDWPLSSFLDSEEYLEIRIFNRNKIFHDRLVGGYRLSLASLCAQGSLEMVDNLIDDHHQILRNEIKLDLRYLKPTAADFYDQGDDIGSANHIDSKSLRSVKTNATMTSTISRGSANDVLDGKDIYHPRINTPTLVNSRVSDFQVHLKIIEARDLAGMSLDPVITITLGEQKKNTSVKPQTNNPFWDEFFVLDFKLPKTKFLDQVMTYQVFTGRSIVSQGSLIGSFKHDLWYIYSMPDHCCFSKWAPLLDGETTECKGYLRMDIGVFGKGDMVKDAPIRKDSDEDIERNLLLPEDVAPFRPVFKYVVKIYKADGIPQMNVNLMANVKKAFTGKVQPLADPFVEVTFAGMRERTSVVKNSYSPDFNEEIEFTEFFPPLCERIKFQLKDSDAMGEEVVGTHFIHFDEISNQHGSYNDRKDSGFLPSFGPSWINLYGSTRDYTMSDEHLELNCGLGEGVAYRGRILVAIECFESEPEDTGRTSKEKNDGPPKNAVGRNESFKLYSTFYEASMIPRKIGDRPIHFEVTMGEYGVYLENPAPKDSKPAKGKNGGSQDELDALIDDFIDEDIYVSTLTPPIKPLCPGKKYFYVPFENVKPCTCLKFPFEDQRRRHYNSIMLLKLFRMLEENVEELDERVRLKLPDSYRLLRRVMGDLVHGCRLYFDLADGKKTGTHLGKNRLDRDRLKMSLIELKNISILAGKIGDSCVNNDNIDSKVREVHGIVRTMRRLIVEPQHGLPDVFVWMLSGNKRVAYARVPAEDILYSKVDFERGRFSGRVQTVFLRLPGKRGHGENGWAIQAKVEVRFWLGLMKHKSDYLLDAPGGYEELEDRPLSAPPERLIYQERQQFVIRAHMYQARSLIGSDDSGLSDAFARVICTNQVLETQVIWKTRSPTWDQMLKFEDIFLWGDSAELAVNPPVIVIEVFDKDEGISTEIEFIGRALAKPVVKLATEEYVKPFFPPVLQWFPIIRGEERAGELLAAFEMLELSDEVFTDIPDDPPTVTTPEGVKIPVPDSIRPIMVKHRVEALFWGVREMKRAQLMPISKPQIDIDCCYNVTMVDSGKSGEVVFSTVCKNAKKNPNFDDPVVIFDVDLPDNKKYIPPITIRVNDCRTFGRHVLAGTHVIDSLYEYFRDPKKISRRTKKEEDTKGKKAIMDDVEVGVMEAVDKQAAQNQSADTATKKTQKKEQSSKEEEVLDWWTRFYETLRDLEKEDTKEKKEEVSLMKKGRKDDSQINADRIPRMKIFKTELELIPEYDGFNDFIRTFPLLRGKKTDDDDDEIKRFSGKVKANLRVWKYPNVPSELTQEEPESTFHRLPSNDPINVLVRVYVIRAIGLHPTDPNGKADPYVSVTLGKKTVKERDSYVSKQLNPEFGKCFEFESILPSDNLLLVQIYDWDMIGDDLIGETKLDIENRFYSKHRASCGIQENYMVSGYAQWRDPQKPTQILTKICKDEGFEGPVFLDGCCKINGEEFKPLKCTIKNERGREIASDEPAALEALRNLNKIPDRGYHLVPEHVETRPLFNPEKPGQEQGKVQMWVDMFPMDLTMPGPAVDVSPRKPIEYELRVIIWNTEDVLPDETNIITGESSSDIFVKGWMEGNREHIQETDVHYRSTDGSGMFNWRFVFPFMFHKAEEKIVTKKKASIFAIDETEEKHPPNLYLQVWDADLFSADDFIGDLILPISRIPAPAKASKSCDLKILNVEPKGSLIKSKHMKGWWPFQVNPEDDDDPNPILAGKVEAELELLTKEDAEAAQAGKGREEPQPLTKPNRPADSFGLFMSPLKMLRYIFWENYKWCLLKALIVSLLLLIAALFIYSMPGYTVKKMFGA